MADYNVNMKQWNGSSFDNVLPLAYNAKQLEGKSLAEVKQWVQDNGLLLYTGQYTGTGTYGQNNPSSITFPFEPILFICPTYVGGYTPFEYLSPLQTAKLKTAYQQINYPDASSNFIQIKKSDDGKTISWYRNSASLQANVSGTIYYFAAIGGYDMGGQTEWAITSSGTWTVPRTGRYYLELYGGGGGANNYGNLRIITGAVSGGSSCQSYDSINLIKGDSISVSIGVGGTSDYGSTSTRISTGTSFGMYSVAAGGMATVPSTTETPSGGTKAGNLGTDGSYTSSFSSGALNYSNGTLKTRYGYGGWGGVSSSTSGETAGGPGAVYLKYLGA